MTPAARVAAAIEVLDQILAGQNAEAALIAWARSSRFAGSKDRASIRDHVFDALRCKRSFAVLGGAMTGRGLMIGAMRASGAPMENVFNGEGHAPAPLTEAEASFTAADMTDAERLDWPEWLWPQTLDNLGDRTDTALAMGQERAPVFLRVNTRKATRDKAIAALARDEVIAVPHPEVATALIVTGNPRRLQNSDAYASGLVEVQDASSQAAVLRLPVKAGDNVLDYCAGGGGKALAIAALGGSITAHDIDAGRMSDIPARAGRAGVQIKTATRKQLRGGYDLVFCDAPCSGSGTWRRAPDAKWKLTPERLAELNTIQSGILDEVQGLVAQNGHLAYATCSLLASENRAIVDGFLARSPNWQVIDEMTLLPSDLWDGFYLAVMARAQR